MKQYEEKVGIVQESHYDALEMAHNKYYAKILGDNMGKSIDHLMMDVLTNYPAEYKEPTGWQKVKSDVAYRIRDIKKRIYYAVECLKGNYHSYSDDYDY